MTTFPKYAVSPYKRLIIILFLFSMVLCSCDVHEATDNPQSASELKEHGDSCMNSGDYNNAMECYINAVKTADRNGDDEISAAAHCNIGIIYAMFLDNEQASYYFNKALDKAYSIGNERLSSVCVTNLMLLAINKKDTAEFSKWRQLKKRYPLSIKKYDLFWDCYASALINIAEHHTDTARKQLREAAEIACDNDWDREHYDMLLVDMGNSWHADNNIDSALYYYDKALCANRGLHNQERAIYRQLNSIYLQTGQTDSLAKYQTLLLALMDTVYDSSRFNLNNRTLIAYGDQIHHDRLSRANTRALILLALCLFFSGLLTAILLLYRRLQLTRRSLVEQNELLLNENEDCKKWRERFYVLDDELNRLREKDEAAESHKPEPVMHDKNSDTCHEERLDSAQRQQIDVDIMRIMDDGKTLFDPNLTINSIASMLKTNSKYVSWTISDIYHVNFRTFIARLRIKEVCRRLADRKFDNITIAAIAEECGFKSVNNFIVVFKKETGVTPKKYRDAAHSSRSNSYMDE